MTGQSHYPLTKLKSMVPPLNSREESEVRIETAMEKLTDITVHRDCRIYNETNTTNDC